METKIPRIMIAGTGSGCGKTTISCAVIKAFVDKGFQTGSFKCGPDYIDPMFHRTITGYPSINLDSFFFSENTLRYLISRYGAGRDICIVEGVMGFYDGILKDGLSVQASSYEISRITRTPVVLAVNAKGAAASVLAVIHGFLTLYPENRICAVIFNQCTPSVYKLLAQEVRKRFEGKVMPAGYLPVLPECSLESRHLGLVTAAETEDLQKKLEILGREAANSIDLELLCRIAGDAPELFCDPQSVLPDCDAADFADVRIAVAKDKAFCFYYEDSMSLLEELGAKLYEFSPVSDPEIPEGVHGLYLGGGYPELYAKQLSQNETMLRSVRKVLNKGMPCIAECGGFMYLTGAIGDAPMADVIDTRCFNTEKLSRFGYIELSASADNLLCRQSETIRAHEFHYWDAKDPGSSFRAVKPSGRSWNCAYANDHMYAGFPHFNFYSNPDFALNYLKACRRWKEKTGDMHEY